MAKMRAVQVSRAGGPLELVEREMPEPARGEIRVRVEAYLMHLGDDAVLADIRKGGDQALIVNRPGRALQAAPGSSNPTP